MKPQGKTNKRGLFMADFVLMARSDRHRTTPGCGDSRCQKVGPGAHERHIWCAHQASVITLWPKMITSSFIHLHKSSVTICHKGNRQHTSTYIKSPSKGRLLSLNTDENAGSGPAGAGWIVDPRQDLFGQIIAVQPCPRRRALLKCCSSLKDDGWCHSNMVINGD